MKANLWITGITSKGNEKHLRELIEPIKHLFDGICWVFHEEEGSLTETDGGYQYLLLEVINEYIADGKEGGKVIRSPWVRRTDHSRNKTLFEGPMKTGDWFLIIDTLERIHPQMIQDMIGLVNATPRANGIYYENKRLFFRMHENIYFSGNPHEGIQGAWSALSLNKENYPAGEKYFTNVRPLYRDKYHWVGAYMNYYLFPNTNHLFLGYENNKEYVAERYKIRHEFLITLLSEEVDSTIPDIKKYIKNNGIEKIKKFINQEKILNDWYRFEFLGDKTVIDKHDPSLIVEVE